MTYVSPAMRSTIAEFLGNATSTGFGIPFDIFADPGSSVDFGTPLALIPLDNIASESYP